MRPADDLDRGDARRTTSAAQSASARREDEGVGPALAERSCSIFSGHRFDALALVAEFGVAVPRQILGPADGEEEDVAPRASAAAAA